MNTYVDVILYIPSYPIFTSVVKQYAPQMISSNNQINTFARTPSVMTGSPEHPSMLVYVRLTQEQAESVLFFTEQIIPETYTVTEYEYSEGETIIDEETEEEYTETISTPVEVIYNYPAELVGMPIVEILAQTEYQGKPTADILYGEIFNDAVKLEKYKSVYDFSPKIVEEKIEHYVDGWDEMTEEENPVTIEIVETVIEKPKRFGMLAS